MSLAIQWGYYFEDEYGNPPTSQGFIYFDAVTAYRRSFSGSVTKQPIGNGGLITDHFTRDNPVITISACISGADISIKGKSVFDNNSNTPQSRRDNFKNVEINSTDKSLLNIIPNIVGQFFAPQKPQVELATQSPDVIDEIARLLEGLFEDEQMQLITLYEYYDGVLSQKQTKNLVMTGFSYQETPDTGDGLFCEITLEKVRFTTTETTRLDPSVSKIVAGEDIKDKAGTVEDKGKPDSTPQKPEDDITGGLPTWVSDWIAEQYRKKQGAN